MRKHNFNFLNVNIIMFKTVYKIVIIMININNVLRKLNALSLKESQNNIKKLINMIEINRISIKSFTIENVFTFLILSTIAISVISKKIN